eukprot:SAG22_NODE_17525_length_303_cov_0.764706_2_plen_29_part_01
MTFGQVRSVLGCVRSSDDGIVRGLLRCGE